MLKKETKTSTTFIDGVLVCKTPEDENIFLECAKVKRLQAELEQAEADLVAMKKESILLSFIGLCHEFKQEFGSFPTTAYMAYWDKSHLETACYKAYGDYYVHLTETKNRSSLVKLKSGCSQDSGHVRLHLVDSPETE